MDTPGAMAPMYKDIIVPHLIIPELITTVHQEIQIHILDRLVQNPEIITIVLQHTNRPRTMYHHIALESILPKLIVGRRIQLPNIKHPIAGNNKFKFCKKLNSNKYFRRISNENQTNHSITFIL